ncbi:RloB family protein [Methylacidimicrobium tartarophylax]|nr:RloB family protein [Methylacidimicrobium tartarophylax]
MRCYLQKERLKSTDEAWLVVDKDQWTDPQLAELHAWAGQSQNYGFAVSNPKFEYWLLLHFEKGNGVTRSSDCNHRLRTHLPNYDKRIDPRRFTRERILDAIKRAKERDVPPCEDWPRSFGTTVYKLVESILGYSPP